MRGRVPEYKTCCVHMLCNLAAELKNEALAKRYDYTLPKQKAKTVLSPVLAEI